MLLDEALVEFADAQPTSSSLELLERAPAAARVPQLLQGLGPRGPAHRLCDRRPRAGELLAELEPDLGVSEVSQAGALEALHSCSDIVGERVQRIREERPYVTSGLRERGFDVTDSQANFVWAAHPDVDGGELAARLARAGMLVAAGEALGEPHHVRIACARARFRPPARRRRPGATALARRGPQPAEPAWRSSAPVVPSRILRHALTSSGSSSKCSTTWRTRLAEMSIPWRSAISW